MFFVACWILLYSKSKVSFIFFTRFRFSQNWKKKSAHLWVLCNFHMMLPRRSHPWIMLGSLDIKVDIFRLEIASCDLPDMIYIRIQSNHRQSETRNLRMESYERHIQMKVSRMPWRRVSALEQAVATFNPVQSSRTLVPFNSTREMWRKPQTMVFWGKQKTLHLFEYSFLQKNPFSKPDSS